MASRAPQWRDSMKRGALRGGALMDCYWSVFGWFIVFLILDLVLIAAAGIALALALGTWDFQESGVGEGSLFHAPRRGPDSFAARGRQPTLSRTWE